MKPHLYLVLLVAPFILAHTASADIVHSDDVIIESRLAVGSDAVDGEAFGFDVIRLKENNLRIHFDDTSSSSHFANNDWRIVINDTQNYGGNYFAVEDSTGSNLIFRVDAGAPSNSLRVSSAGWVGINNNGDPKALLHVRTFVPSDGVIIGPSTVSSNRATLHVEGTGYFQQDLEVGSSRDLKERISALTAPDALAALEELVPVHFRYKESSEDQLGFIAEDVPELVASEGRKSLSPMDLIAVLTSVTKQQQDLLAAQQRALEDQKAELEQQKSRLEMLERTSRQSVE